MVLAVKSAGKAEAALFPQVEVERLSTHLEEVIPGTGRRHLRGQDLHGLSHVVQPQQFQDTAGGPTGDEGIERLQAAFEDSRQTLRA